jgi:hypothetical protein
VLRASYFQGVVRHAIAAIGALHGNLELQTCGGAVVARGYAFKQYNKAINILIAANESLSTETVLTACILFTWFDIRRATSRSP